MRFRSLGACTFLGLAVWIMGASSGPDRPGGPGSTLGRHPFFPRTRADLPTLERLALEAAGTAYPGPLRELLTLVEAWRAREGLAVCGHAEAHELTATTCSRAPGGALDELYATLLEAWWSAGEITPGVATLLYGGLPPFLAETHVLEGDRLVPTLLHLGAEELRAERRRLVDEGLSGAALWSPAVLVESVERRLSSGVDVAALEARLNPEGRDLRRDLVEGIVRPLGLHQGVTGRGGEELRAFAARHGPGGEPLPLPERTPAPAAAGSAPAEEPPAAVAEAPPAPREEATPPAPPPAEEVVQIEGPGFAVGYGGSRFR